VLLHIYVTTLWKLTIPTASVTSAQIAKFCATESGNPNVCYSVNIPADTASKGSGDIFFQITSPTTNAWVGMGQQSDGKARMAGAHVFMVYADASGTNVTVSPRLATGHFMPQPDPTTKFAVLDGTGIKDGMMTANIRCKSSFISPSHSPMRPGN
jgi:hypothetical protein